jgi:outer membrane protein OmpA-like peptidoglycan-associated protein
MRKQILAVAVVLLAGCAKKLPPPAPAPPPAPVATPAPKQNLIVLLPEPDGKVGKLTITNAGGTSLLDHAYAAARVENAATAPESIVIDEARTRQLFGSVLDALPLAQAQFQLYFQQATDQLVPESAAMLSEVVRAIRDRRSTDVSVVGHTDTTDDARRNYELGLRRARAVAELLKKSGADAAVLNVASHGEANPLVKTGDNVAEPKNRRVEIVVR